MIIERMTCRAFDGRIGSCPACGGDVTRPVVWLKAHAESPVQPPAEDGYSIPVTRQGHALSVLACPGCGFAWLPDLPPASEDYYDYGQQDIYLYEEANRLRTAREVLSVLPGAVPGNNRLLDVGASVGYFTRAAQDMGYRATGIEPSTWAVGYGRERLGVDMVAGSILTAEFAPESIDVVLLMDMIEHTMAFNDVLSKVRNWLKPGGLLLVSTPDIGAPVSRLLGRRWWSLKPEHVIYFTRKALRSAMCRHGFAPQKELSYPRAFSLPYILYLLTGRQSALGLTSCKGIRVPFNFLDQMLCLFRKA